MVHLIKHDKLEKLEISRCNITDYFWISEFLCLKELTHLDLSHNLFNSGAVYVEEKQYFMYNNLQFLSFFNCKLSPDFTHGVIKKLKGFKSLHYLNLGLNTIEAHSTVVDDIATVICNNTQISDFSLPTCLLSSNMMRLLLSALKCTVSLKFLDFNINQVNDMLADDVGALMAHNHNLVQLKFSELVLTQDGFNHIVDSLQVIKGLKNISITGVVLTDKDAHHIATLIANNNSIQSLDISNCILSEKKTIFIAMKHLVSLKSLNLQNIVITDDVEDELAAVIAKNINLKRLEMSGCKMNEAFSMKLSNILSNFKSVTFSHT